MLRVNHTKKIKMLASLLLIHPNDLETLIIEAETIQYVLESSFIRQSFYLGNVWEALNQVLNPANQQAENSLKFIIQTEHPLSEKINQPSLVRYNTVVRVSEIQKNLQHLTVDEIKKRYQFTVANTAPEALEQELRLAELKLIYLQLQDFYREAIRNNWAVVSVFQEKIQPEKLI